MQAQNIKHAVSHNLLVVVLVSGLLLAAILATAMLASDAVPGIFGTSERSAGVQSPALSTTADIQFVEENHMPVLYWPVERLSASEMAFIEDNTFLPQVAPVAYTVTGIQFVEDNFVLPQVTAPGTSTEAIKFAEDNLHLPALAAEAPAALSSADIEFQEQNVFGSISGALLPHSPDHGRANY